jgi:hypothetical protein
MNLFGIDNLENGPVLLQVFPFQLAGGLQFSLGVFLPARTRLAQTKIVVRFPQGRLNRNCAL